MLLTISPIREGNQKILIQMLLTLSSLIRFSRVLRDDSSFVRCPSTISTDFEMFVFQIVVSFFFYQLHQLTDPWSSLDCYAPSELQGLSVVGLNFFLFNHLHFLLTRIYRKCIHKGTDINI